MGKVKICLDKACEKYIFLDDGTTIIQKKKKCSTNWKPGKNFDKEYDEIADGTNSTIFAKEEIFTDTKVGTDIPISGGGEDIDLKAEEIKALEKRLKELKV